MPPQKSGNLIRRLALTDDNYHITRSVRGDDYSVTHDDTELLAANLAELKDGRLTFTHAGTPVFQVERSTIDDSTGYVIVDNETDTEAVAITRPDRTLSGSWEVREPETRALIAVIHSTDPLVNVAKAVTSFGKFREHGYNIVDSENTNIGTIAARHDFPALTHHVHIEDASTVPKEAVVAATLAFDALES